MTAQAEQTLNVTVAQVEDALLSGQTVPDFAREWAEPPANVLAIYRRLQEEGRLPRNGPAQVATKAPVTPVAGERALTSVPALKTTTASAPPSVDALVSAAARSTSKRTQALGVRLHDLAGVLRQRLSDEREAAEAAEQQERERAATAAEVERLEAQLRQAKAKLRPARQGGGSVSRPSASPAAAAAIVCAKGCGKPFKDRRGVALHEKSCGGAA